MANANILFDNETFPHVTQSKSFVSCLNDGNPLYTSIILRPKFWKYKISKFLQAFLFSARADTNYQESCLRSAVKRWTWFKHLLSVILCYLLFLSQAKQLLPYIAFVMYLSDNSFIFLIWE